MARACRCRRCGRKRIRASDGLDVKGYGAAGRRIYNPWMLRIVDTLIIAALLAAAVVVGHAARVLIAG